MLASNFAQYANVNSMLLLCFGMTGIIWKF